MFDEAPSEVFVSQSISHPPHEFYSESEHIISGEEDLAVVEEISIRLADFSTGKDASPTQRHVI